MGLIILLLYSLTQFIIGRIIFRKLLDTTPLLFEVIASFLLGIFVSIPVTYVLACMFAFTGEPILWGMIGFIVLSLAVRQFRRTWDNEHGTKNIGYRAENKKQQASSAHFFLSDIFLLLFSFAFSSWMMFKTFRWGVGGQLFVGSNNVFDFGLLIGLVRSFSWGGNIPFSNPFFSGFPLFYHFFFHMWVAVWEYSGIPIIWAVNIPSALSFTALLIVIYYMPQMVIKKGKLVGWVAVFLTITHSTMTFWHLLRAKGMSMQLFKDIWILPTYPFAGPFDGSVVSIFTTLNSYVNQRHLALSCAVGILLYMMVAIRIERKQVHTGFCLFIGFLGGLMFLWNMAICIIATFLICFLLILFRMGKPLIYFLIGYSGTLLLSLIQYMPYVVKIISAVHGMVGGTFTTIQQSIPVWTLGQYIWENLGILSIIALLGFFILKRKEKVFMFPFILLFILECILAGIGKRGFDQKFYSFLIIGINIAAGVGIAWIWERRGFMFRIAAIIVLFIATVSGFVDLMAIKNEFAYPFVSKGTESVLSWIHLNTAKNATFVSYADIIDPVVLSGRNNYLGFYGNFGWTDRSEIVKSIYAGDIQTAKKLHVSYILVPKWDKNDFPYIVDDIFFREHKMLVYEDEKYSIFSIK